MSTQTLEILRAKEYIKAGAGAGKTFKITQKIGQLVKQGTIEPDKILAVTFTNAAASEMRERIRSQLIKDGLTSEAEKVKEATISTIHGFGLKLIERFAYEQGISPKPRQLTEAEEDQLIRRALAQVSAIGSVLKDLKAFGYAGGFQGDQYTPPVDQFKARILTIIKKLRTLGKGDLNQAGVLIKQAQTDIAEIYGLNLSKSQTLESSLWSAIEALKKQYPEKDALMALWGSNDVARKFIDTIYSVTQTELKTDWSIWRQMQTIKAPKIEKSDDAGLAYAIWNAADKLCVHPGPLQEAQNHIQALLNGALEALDSYQHNKQANGLVDFSDMVQLAHQLLNAPEAAAEMVAQYDCLIIDEFQDTNPLQFALLDAFQKAGVPTLIVGDLKQSIMGFQGSDARLFSGLLQKGEHDANIHIDELLFNWRSTPAVMAFVNAMGNQLYGAAYQPLAVKDEAAYDSSLPAVQKLVFDPNNWAATSRSQSKHSMNHDAYHSLAHHIQTLLAQGVEITDKHTNKKRALRPSDIAVLAPKHDMLQTFSDTLNQFGIKTKLSQSGFLNSDAVQWVINGLVYIADTRHHFALLNLLTSSYAHASLESLLQAYIEHKRFNHPLEQQLRDQAKSIQLMDFSGAVSATIKQLGIMQKIECRTDYRQQRANLLKLMQLAEDFEQIQPEPLEAMGIYGKNINTFILWLNQSVESEGFDKLPQVDNDADESVVLTTWHASKGLEWPVVMVLGLHNERKPSLPSIDVAYQTDNIDQMLDTSYVRFLFDFADPNTQQRMLDALAEDNLNTLKNLTYVVLTRARESLILPWFEKDDGKLSMLTLIAPLFEQPGFEHAEKNMIYIDQPDDSEANAGGNQTHLAVNTLNLLALTATISPSSIHAELNTQTQVQSHAFSTRVDLKPLERHLEANEIGTWVHKIYEVATLKPQLIPQCRALLPQVVSDMAPHDAIHQQASELLAWINTLNPLTIQAEVPILSKNALNQTLSGTIDLLVETADGYWIIDHKTDMQTSPEKHIAQLQSYAGVLEKTKPVQGIAINWVREGRLDVLPSVNTAQ